MAIELLLALLHILQSSFYFHSTVVDFQVNRCICATTSVILTVGTCLLHIDSQCRGLNENASPPMPFVQWNEEGTVECVVRMAGE